MEVPRALGDPAAWLCDSSSSESLPSSSGSVAVANPPLTPIRSAFRRSFGGAADENPDFWMIGRKVPMDSAE